MLTIHLLPSTIEIKYSIMIYLKQYYFYLRILSTFILNNSYLF
jgi:hypothetical protein